LWLIDRSRWYPVLAGRLSGLWASGLPRGRQRGVEFRILGPVSVSDGSLPVVVSAAKQRALLAILLLNANQPVATNRLIDQLWDGRPPMTARKVLQTYVSKLRRAVGESVLITSPAGYELRVGSGQLDLDRFSGLVAQAREASPLEAAGLLRRALAEWRGPPLADVRDEAFALAEASQLEELRLAALEDRADADLELGRHRELLVELRALVDQYPLRERLRARLMVALYRSGRQAEALEVYREGRRWLVEELGVEPGPVLQELEAAILRQDPTLLAPSSAKPGITAHVSGLRSASPPVVEPEVVARPPARRGRSLPVPATSFVGRRHELSVVQALLRRRDVRLVSLTGPGGVGKTRLASAAAVLAGFRDGVVFVDLSMVREPRLVMGAVAEAIGLLEVGPQRAAEEVAEYLAPRQLLLVLDNFEQVLGATPVLGRLLAAAPELTILVTSRARLRVEDEYAFAVPPLTLPPAGAALSGWRAFDAVALFVERGESARPGFTVTEATVGDVAELCRRLDGLPLALELAAARLPLLSPRGILDRLGRRLDLLRSTTPGGVERHRTLRAALEWSHDLLTAPQQALFAGLGVFVGGFTVDAAEQVAKDGELDVLDGVESLLSASLLRPLGVVGDEPRFGMLETVREYALECAARADEYTRLRDRHARWCLTLAERAEPALRGPDQVRWLERLDVEHDNLHATLAWTAEGGDPDVGLCIGAALWRFWQVRGHIEEGRTRLERLLHTELGSGPARAAAQLTVARCAFVQGDFAALQRYTEACVPVLRASGDEHSVGFALMILGAATGTRGEHGRGVALLQEALAIARRSGNRWLEASCLGYHGTVLASGGQVGAARHALEEGLAAARALGDYRSVGWMLITLGRIARADGDPEHARARVTEALAVQQRLGDIWGISNALREVAALALDGRGDQVSARTLLTESLSLASTVQDRPTIAAGLNELARLAASCEPLRAAQLLGCASALDRALNDPLVGPGKTETWVTTLRTSLGDQPFADAWARGRAMTLPDAVAYALAQDDDSAGDA